MTTETKPTALSAQELTRYSRHLILPEVGREGQERLRRASVLIVGAGGLGSPAALYLAAAGIGRIGMADFDNVEEHNLQRQILHGSSDIGRPKVESAAARLTDLNPYIRISSHPDGLSPDNSTALFSKYDLILDGTDNFATRYLNNDSAFFAGKPLVYGSIFRFEGQASLFHPTDGTPCYRCLFPDPPPPGKIPNCADAGVLGALPGAIGSFQAIEAIKHLLGIGENLRGRLLIFDALAMTFRTINIKKDPDCPLCGGQPRISRIDPENYAFSCQQEADMESGNGKGGPPLEVTVEETRGLVKRDSGDLDLLDVREPYEVEICRIAGAREIPMDHIPQRIDELPRDRPLLVYCHHGMRSLHVVKYLRDRGFPLAQSVRGGIDAWAREIDSGMARY